MSVYSTRFLDPAAGAAGTYTVPAGYVAVVRSITACLPAFSGTGVWSVQDTTAGTYIASGTLPQAGQAAGFPSVSVTMRYVCPAGSVLEAASQAGIYVTVSGYLLSLP